MPDDRISTYNTKHRPRHDKYERLVEAASKLRPSRTAIAHPCDQVSLESAVEAARLGLIAPILVGPEARIRAVATKSNIDIAGLPIINTEHSNESAAKAVEQVRQGHAEALMKGSLQTDELMGAVVCRRSTASARHAASATAS